MRDYFKNGVVVLNATHSYSVADTESSEVMVNGGLHHRRALLHSDISVSSDMDDDDDDDSAVTTTTEGSMTRMNTMPDVSISQYSNQQDIVEMMKLKEQIAELDLAIAMLKNKLPDDLNILILRIEKESKEKIHAAINVALRREGEKGGEIVQTE